MARIKPQALLQQSKKKKGPARMSLTTIILFSLIVVLIVFFLFSTYRHWTHRSRFQSDNGLFVSEVLNTSKGHIAVELYKESTPEVVDEFIDFCQKGHFNGMPFTHVIKHTVIQAGKNQKFGASEDWTSRGKHYSQLDSSLKHEAFMLGTSKGKRDNKGFELFITTAPIPNLNEKVIVFGRVVKGEDVVQEIEEVDTDENYEPKSSIGIINVSLRQKI
ncbi:hypothetical protein RGQ29_007849 [Quercus rubra]|uniref:Peptidyl-prolyl cis-trans isomerase n=1 Tax=Quercus rubra TaxID=3512 RepID=A0AAN7HVX0_QUERU|nr:hypothetical protein RGQ29_007849 [Quercus rubra]